MKRTTGLTLAAFLGGCSGTVEPQLLDLSLTGVGGAAPPVVLQAANPRVEILGGTLSGGPHRDFCDFRIVQRITPLEGAVTTGDVGGQASCEWVDDRIARVTIDLTLGGTHVYSFGR
jgi:hypothetical protein